MLKNLLTLVAASVLCTLPLLAHSAAPNARDVAVHVEKEGSAFTVQAELTIPANVDEVWDVLTDFDNMAQILSNVDASKITNRDGNKFEVIQKSHASAGLLKLSLDSVRQVELAPKKEIRSHLLKGDLKSSDFTTRLIEDGPVTKVTVSGKFVASGLTAGAISVETVQAQTQRQYQELRDEVVRRKTKQPTPPCILAKNCTPGSSG